MITFITALYPEAKGLIDRLNLKKNPEETLYQLFEGEQFRLVITGTGMISAAAVTARHFAKFPPVSGQDLVINLGIAGGYFSENSDVCIGDLFLISKITGRTFYPDLLYRHHFRLSEVITSAVVHTEYSTDVDSSLIDMEASALYQTLLPHSSPDRIFFFKVLSDLPGQPQEAPVQPEALLAPHLDSILSFAKQLHAFLRTSGDVTPQLSCEELSVSDEIRNVLPMTEAMVKDYERLLSYAKLAGKPLKNILQDFKTSLTGLTIRGKKQAMPHLLHLRELILNEEETLVLPAQNTSSNHEIYQPFFTTVYA